MSNSNEQKENINPLPAELEALLFAADTPLTSREISEALTGIEEDGVSALVEALDRVYRTQGHAIMVQKVAGGWRLATRAEYAELIRRFLREKQRSKLTRASLETLAIIAYRQPVSRGEIEAIRGVDSTQVLRNLLERSLIRITGRAEVPGRPLLYGTTSSFLTYFGLDNLDSLPQPEELLGESDLSSEIRKYPREGPFSAGVNPQAGAGGSESTES